VRYTTVYVKFFFQCECKGKALTRRTLGDGLCTFSFQTLGEVQRVFWLERNKIKDFRFESYAVRNSTFRAAKRRGSGAVYLRKFYRQSV